jgi:small subunit ribosomal protein S16
MPRDGRFVANLGHYNPRTEPATLVVDKPQVRQWLAKGAVPTETVAKLLGRIDLQNDDEPTVVESAVAAVTGTAKKAASAVAAAAGAVVETVVETAQAAADQVREVVSGEEAPAEDSSAADEAAAKVEADTTSAE